jgi:hypothetical protein
MSKVFCLPEYKNGTKQRRSVEKVESFYLIVASRNTYILLCNISPSLTISWVVLPPVQTMLQGTV